MKTSIVLSTYNGSKYIIGQIESIRLQTKNVDEVIICDDCSKDNTVELVNNYIQKYNLKNWIINCNTENKGYIKNFLDGAQLATGNVIFFSDQDDIWDNKKIEIMLNVFIEKNALAVYCLSDTIDENGKKRKNSIEKINRIRGKFEIDKVSLCKKLKYSRSPGLCLAFKKNILNEVYNMSMKYNLPHDLPVGTVSAIKDGYYVVNKVLVHHRVHNNNVSKPDVKLQSSFFNIQREIDSRKLKQREFKAINESYRGNLKEYECRELDKAISINNDIIKYLKNRKVMGILRLFFNNCKMINKKLIIRNILAVIFCKRNGEKNEL